MSFIIYFRRRTKDAKSKRPTMLMSKVAEG